MNRAPKLTVIVTSAGARKLHGLEWRNDGWYVMRSNKRASEKMVSRALNNMIASRDESMSDEKWSKYCEWIMKTAN